MKEEKFLLTKEQEEKVNTLLNEIAFLEFNINYNKNEYERIALSKELRENKELRYYKKELESILPIIKGISYDISDSGSLTVMKKDEEITFTNAYQVIKTYYHSILLPYGYVMGKKMSKRDAEKFSKELGSIFTRYKREEYTV